MSFLPGLDELGSIPTVTPSQLIELVDLAQGDTALLSTLFLSDDLLQRQAYLAGEIEELELAVLTRLQGQGKERLPDYLVGSAEESVPETSVDAIWHSYYTYAAAIARERKSNFLEAWIEYEVGLRNALAFARARALNLDPHEYVVASEVGRDLDDFSDIVSQWLAATDPFNGLRLLDQQRWLWITENEPWFSFTDDELVSYGAKLMLLRRWMRLGERERS
ncbi:MAG: DUF2764 family protein [Dehalococcoidia bacterium]